MLDIEARLTLEVADVERAAAEIRRLTSTSQGDVVEESISDANSAARGQLTVRVPSASAYDLLAQLEKIGTLRSRELTAKDIGKTYYDAQLRLQNLEWQMARFEQILARANSVDEIMRVDQEIARVRGQIEQIKGELRFLADRAARATIRIVLLAPHTFVPPPPPIVRPEAKFFPGVRVSLLADVLGEEGTRSYWGAGLSLRLSRHLSLDLEGLRGMPSESAGLDLFLATLGGELYSEFLGAGRRKWFNPYLGLRGGYARRSGKNEIAAGGSLGVEIYKAEFLTLELEARFYGLFGSSAGAHLAMQPALGANIAF